MRLCLRGRGQEGADKHGREGSGDHHWCVVVYYAHMILCTCTYMRTCLLTYVCVRTYMDFYAACTSTYTCVCSFVFFVHTYVRTYSSVYNMYIL